MPEAPWSAPWSAAEPALRSRLRRAATGAADPTIDPATRAVTDVLGGAAPGPATAELLTVGLGVRLLAAAGARDCGLAVEAAVCAPLAAAAAIRASGAGSDTDRLRAALMDAVSAGLATAGASPDPDDLPETTIAAVGAARLVAGLTGLAAAERRRAERAAVALTERVLAGGERPRRVDIAIAAGCGTRAARRTRGARPGAPAPAPTTGDPALLANLPLAGQCPWTVGPLRAVLHALALLGPGRSEPVRVDVGLSPAALAHAQRSGDEAGCDLRAAVATALLRAGRATSRAPRLAGPDDRAAVPSTGSVRQLVRRIFLYEHAACDADLPYHAGAVVTVRARGGHRVTFRAAPGGQPDVVLAGADVDPVVPAPASDDVCGVAAAALLDELSRDRLRLTG